MMDASDTPAGTLPAVDNWQCAEQSTNRTNSAEFAELFCRYQGPIGRFLAQMVSDRALADDLTQETFIAAFGEREHLESIRNPEAWLFRIARNCALQALRKRRRAWNVLRRLSLERPDQEADPAEGAAVRDHLIRTLKPEERSVLILRYVHGFSSQELAGIVGRSPEAVRQELSRTRRKLIKSLNQIDANKNGSEA